MDLLSVVIVCDEWKKNIRCFFPVEAHFFFFPFQALVLAVVRQLAERRRKRALICCWNGARNRLLVTGKGNFVLVTVSLRIWQTVNVHKESRSFFFLHLLCFRFFFPNFVFFFSLLSCSSSFFSSLFPLFFLLFLLSHSEVNITNFTTSWKDGLAFCAICHRYFPSSLSYTDCIPKTPMERLTAAFNVRENKKNRAVGRSEKEEERRTEQSFGKNNSKKGNETSVCLLCWSSCLLLNSVGRIFFSLFLCVFMLFICLLPVDSSIW